MKRGIAVFPGSFDPPTRAHEWVLRAARDVFEEVVVLVATNGAKGGGLLKPEERVAAWKTATACPVVVMDRKKSIRQEVEERHAKFVIRGIRGAGDVEPEQAYFDFLQRECPHTQVVHFMVPSELRTMSSTVARSIVGLEDWHTILVPYLSAGVVLTIARAIDPGAREAYQPGI